METPDYYEFLQISPNAEPDTIHRVYRYLAVRFHPDNPKTGDTAKFFLLKQAYDVLSDSARRAEYDEVRKKRNPHTIPLSTTIDFMDALDGELNRRLGVLALLYVQRRTNPYAPEVSFIEIESRMGFPREYLEFTIWYLKNKGFITRADNSDLALTAEGVDFVETQRVNIPILSKLLTDGTIEAVPFSPPAAVAKGLIPSRTPIVVPSSPTPIIVPASTTTPIPEQSDGSERISANSDGEPL
jgi:curved DNA-binding protein